MGNDILQSKAGRDKPRKVTELGRNYDDDFPLPWILTRMICHELPRNLKITRTPVLVYGAKERHSPHSGSHTVTLYISGIPKK